MPRRPDLYRTRSTSSLFDVDSNGASVTVASGELDLRKEFDEILFGFESGIRHGHLVVVRNMRRDAEGNPVHCTCRDDFTREADPDCVYCLGEGYLWDENWAWTYSMYSGSNGGMAGRVKYMPPGSMRVDTKIFFLRFDTAISYRDKIIEIKLDEEGNVVVPYKRETLYRPGTIQKYRSDNGRLEYIAVHCREEDAIRTDTPEG